MKRQEFCSVLGDTFKTCFVELVERHQCVASELNPSDVDYGQSRPIAYIDAGSKDFELVISLSLPFNVLERLYPLSEQVLIDEGVLEDWLKELSNLLIGWLKIKLDEHNCQMQIGLPEFHHGESHEEIHPEDHELSLFHFYVEYENCECGMSLKCFSEELSYDDSGIPVTDPELDADVVLFN